jgi:AcrR family transcriptional regulator
MLCPDPREAVACHVLRRSQILRSSGFRLGCPVASVALDVASTTETVHKPYADVFASWINAPAEGIAASGTPRETATDLASYILASLEGAIILSRTSKSVKPLEQTAQFVLRTIQETIRETIEEKLPRLSHKAKGARSGTRT